jgi:hypothetical protein
MIVQFPAARRMPEDREADARAKIIAELHQQAGLAAAAAAPATTGPDAELIELGRQWDYLLSRRETVRQLLRSPSSDDVNDAMYPIACRIMALTATTFAGLAVKARVTHEAYDHYWDEPEADRDWDVQMVCSLIESVLNTAAVS